MLRPDRLIDKDYSSCTGFWKVVRKELKCKTQISKSLKMSGMRIEGLKKNEAVIVENPPQTHYDRHYQEVHPCLL
jgi:hypothetical protein